MVIKTNDFQNRPIRAPQPPSFVQDHNGVLYERVVREYLPDMTHQRVANSSPLHLPTTKLVRTRPSSPEDFHFRGSRHNANPHDGGQSTVLPSIEGSDGLPLSPRERRNAFDRNSEPRDMHDHIHDRRSLRDPVLAEYPRGTDYAPRHRLVEPLIHHQPVQQYHQLREASPIRYAEPIYRSRDDPNHSRFETLPAKQFGPPKSPRLVSEGYTDRQLVHDFRNLPYADANADRTTFVAADLRENARYLRALPSDHGYSHGHTAPSSARLPQGEPEPRPLQYGTRLHEATIDTRSYDNHVARERNMGAGQEFVQHLPQEPGVRYSYPSASIVREPLEPLSRQQGVDNGYAPRTARSHALPSYQ